MIRRIGAALATAALIVGCADIFGLGDYTESDGSTGDEGGADVVVGGDAMPDAGVEAGCTAMEVCNDGVDNDCNGHIDCDDTACAAGWSCVPAPPNGWAFVGYDQQFRPACNAGFGTPIDVVEGLSAGAATCACGCNVKAPGCGPMVVTAGNGGTNGCDNGAKQNETGNANCQILSATINTNSAKMSVTVAVDGGGCSPDAGVTAPSVAFTYQGRTCELATPTGSGCGQQLCAPRPSPFVLCVRQSGVVACPNGYPVQHIVGTTVADGRGCTPCTCGYNGAGATCKGTVTFYSNTVCSAGAQNVTADGTCQTVANGSWKGYIYAPQMTSGSCTPSAVSPTGDAGLGDPTTICCTN